MTSSLKCRSGVNPREPESTPVIRKLRSGTVWLLFFKRLCALVESREKIVDLAPGRLTSREPLPVRANQADQFETEIDGHNVIIACARPRGSPGVPRHRAPCEARQGYLQRVVARPIEVRAIRWRRLDSDRTPSLSSNANGKRKRRDLSAGQGSPTRHRQSGNPGKA